MLKKRESNIELLRIIAMFMIISYHFVYRSNWSITFLQDGYINYYLCLLGSFGQIGVDLFFIISGFHMAQSKNLNPRKVLPIARKTWFYSLAIFLFSYYSIPPLSSTNHRQKKSLNHSFLYSLTDIGLSVSLSLFGYYTHI